MLYAPVAQLDRVPGYEPGGRTFESCRARHFCFHLVVCLLSQLQRFIPLLFIAPILLLMWQALIRSVFCHALGVCFQSPDQGV